MEEAMNPGFCDWVASLLNSAAVVLWRHLGNRGNSWTYPLTLAASETTAESKLIWAPLCSLVCRPQAGQPARQRVVSDQILWLSTCVALHIHEHMNSGMSGWEGQILLILKCQIGPCQNAPTHTHTHQKSKVVKNNTLQSPTNQAWLC